ncbi:protein YqhG of unknown function [Alteribacillus persepolensis]|uniref:YqhG n=1 Tax=Alteribacillus persepolensis TaxID=568899 RepID=A0A1G8CXK8_9BACI|nr:YqhG family protein [Alteribacillus persepolensis]SDH50238.1 protein YqhG of unknown function [Alteribacillus persepolensis]
MEQHALHQFVRRYFSANDADILHDDNKRLTVQLTEELDQQLMNRPFYWQYIKKTGGVPQPMTLTFITKGEKEKQEKAEYLHFGSPRLHQIFTSAKQKGTWTILYEETEAAKEPTPLFPWLLANVKVSYASHQRKDSIYSFGLQLIHGQMVDNMMEKLKQKSLHNLTPAHSFPMHSLIQTTSGLQRMKRYLEQQLSEESGDWAENAWKRMKEELHILEAYHTSSSQPKEEYEQEKQAIIERYQPQINVSIINSGLFYLGDSSLPSDIQ